MKEKKEIVHLHQYLYDGAHWVYVIQGERPAEVKVPVSCWSLDITPGMLQKCIQSQQGLRSWVCLSSGPCYPASQPSRRFVFYSSYLCFLLQQCLGINQAWGSIVPGTVPTEQQMTPTPQRSKLLSFQGMRAGKSAMVLGPFAGQAGWYLRSGLVFVFSLLLAAV